MPSELLRQGGHEGIEMRSDLWGNVSTTWARVDGSGGARATRRLNIEAGERVPTKTWRSVSLPARSSPPPALWPTCTDVSRPDARNGGLSPYPLPQTVLDSSAPPHRLRP